MDQKQRLPKHAKKKNSTHNPERKGKKKKLENSIRRPRRREGHKVGLPKIARIYVWGGSKGWTWTKMIPTVNEKTIHKKYVIASGNYWDRKHLRKEKDLPGDDNMELQKKDRATKVDDFTQLVL